MKKLKEIYFKYYYQYFKKYNNSNLQPHYYNN